MLIWFEIDKAAQLEGTVCEVSKQVDVPCLPPVGALFFPDATIETPLCPALVKAITLHERMGYVVLLEPHGELPPMESERWEVLGWKIGPALEFMVSAATSG